MSSATKPLVCLRKVSKVFHAGEVETHAVISVDLDISEGEYVSIAGPSGCGKSTLLSLIGMLDTATEGQYLFDGRDVFALSAAERAEVRNGRIGFVFQNFQLIDDLTVFENVALPLVYRSMAGSTVRELVTEALERVGMSHRMKHYPTQLSGGQQQRVAAARAIVGRPSILLADEPTGNLDSANGAVVMELLRQLHEAGSTVCMVTHDPRYSGHADRAVNLFDGRIVADRPTAGAL